MKKQATILVAVAILATGAGAVVMETPSGKQPWQKATITESCRRGLENSELESIARQYVRYPHRMDLNQAQSIVLTVDRIITNWSALYGVGYKVPCLVAYECIRGEQPTLFRVLGVAFQVVEQANWWPESVTIINALESTGLPEVFFVPGGLPPRPVRVPPPPRRQFTLSSDDEA
jgi:hypothetical protein